MRKKTVNLKIVCYIIMIMFIFQLSNYNIDIVNSGEPQAKPVIKKMPTSEIFKKLGTILSDSNVIVEIFDANSVILNQANKKIFITQLKKIALMKDIEIIFDPVGHYGPPLIMPDTGVNIYKKNNKDKKMIQILYFSGPISKNESEEGTECIFFSTLYIDTKQIPGFIISIWGKDAHNFISEIRAIYNKQQAASLKKR
ncbi:MAG: hypothetical protein HZB23_00435 [Deltaproteobacteria bacterium]|nr:hypothetical protein [Deltaproteobacteria bacterium]